MKPQWPATASPMGHGGEFSHGKRLTPLPAQIEPASTMKLLAVHIAASSDAKNNTIRAR